MTAAADPTPGSHPHLNVLTDGFRTALRSIPENQETMYEQMEQTMRAFSPRNKFHLWLTDDIALLMLRLDRLARIERRERDRMALRAETFWDDDRRLIANEVAAGLHRDPGRVVPKLKSTPQGCDWLIERWGWLGRVLESGLAWDKAQTKLAIDLMGTPVEVRNVAASWITDPAKLVRDEVAAITARKAQVAESDALDRTLAMTDAAEPDTPELRRLRRYEASLHKRMRWSIEQLDLMPKFKDPHPDVADWRDRSWVSPILGKSREQIDAERMAQWDLNPEPEPEPEAPPPVAPANDPPPAPMQTAPRSHRPDPVKLRARTRQAAKKRRRDRTPQPVPPD